MKVAGAIAEIKPEEIGPAIRRGVEATLRGEPALIEFITAQETRASRF